MRNNVLDRYRKRFFAMCKDTGLGLEMQKQYYKSKLGATHIADITVEQWQWVFDDMNVIIKKKAEEEGTIFTDKLDDVLEELLV